MFGICLAVGLRHTTLSLEMIADSIDLVIVYQF